MNQEHNQDQLQPVKSAADYITTVSVLIFLSVMVMLIYAATAMQGLFSALE